MESSSNEQNKNKNDETALLEGFYSVHHTTGNRLKQSYFEDERSKVYTDWIGTGKTLLDLGCRDGTLTRHFLEGNKVTGGDIDSDALAYAQKTYNIETAQINLNSRLPFDDETFDVVTMAEVLEHLPYPSITLSEIKRVLKKGGCFLGNVPLAYHLKDRYRVARGKKLIVGTDHTHLQYFTYKDLRTLLEREFFIEDVHVLKGSRFSWLSIPLFARNIAFKCKKEG